MIGNGFEIAEIYILNEQVPPPGSELEGMSCCNLIILIDN